MIDLQEKYANKIAGLLAKAESTTPEEAELLTEKAAQLMAQYAIEQAMVDKARGRESDEKIVEKRVTYKSSYHHALFEIGATIARANDCRVLVSRSSYAKNTSVLIVIGFESDVDRVIMLDASLQIQAQAALRAGRRSGAVRSEQWMTAMEKFLETRDFLFGFATGVGRRLARARKAGQDDYLSEAVLRGGVKSEVSSGMELVIRSRRDRVNDWMDQTYGKLRTARGGVTSCGTGASRSAGLQAGLNADTGSAGRVGQRRALNR